MSFIDWSDSETMFGLLLEYVADERGEARDAARRVLLARLQEQLQAVQEIWDVSPSAEAIGALRAIHRSIPDEFQSDPVVEHLGACVGELERIQATTPS